MMSTSKSPVFLGLFLLAVWTTACTLDDISGTDTGATGGTDVEAAGSILGESLSRDESGIILSLNDALTTVSENSFIAQNPKALSADRSGRGSETNYRHSYRQQTGIHAVSFKRQVQDALFSKTVTDSMHYRYRSKNGTPIQYPRQNQNNISSIYFDGRHEGQISTLQKQSIFVRRDTFIISDINTPELSVNGMQHARGSIQVESKNQGSFQRNYKLEINLLDITVSEMAFNNSRNFWQHVSGTLSWQLHLDNQPGGGTNDKSMGGTIKLAGGGIALLNFRSSAKKLQINLSNGDIKDQEKEFEGRIASVNLSDQRISLVNGRILYLTSDTEIEEEDYTSLDEVQKDLNTGVHIWAEGEGMMQDGRFIVTEIEFEREDEDDDDDGDDDNGDEEYIEFEEDVSAVDVEAGIFTLAEEVTVLITSTTKIDDDGDYQTLQAVADALANGIKVQAEGEAWQNSPESPADLTAAEVEFKEIESDNEDDNRD